MNMSEQKPRKSYESGRGSFWVVDGLDDTGYLDTLGNTGPYFDFKTKAEAQAALDLYLEKQRQKKEQPAQIRTFDSGATRDTTQGKLDYVKALSPIVLRRYVQYLDKHRLQPDGSYRDFDNWKQGIPQDIYHSSGGRHFFDTWLLTEGYTTEDNHGPVDIEDALCAQLFNIQGRLHEILKDKVKKAC